MKKYKTIGILGGMGPEATAALYLCIIRIFQREYGAVHDYDFPEIILLNLPMPDIVENIAEEKSVEMALKAGVKKLQNAGADFIAVPCNTVQAYLPKIQAQSGIPIITAADAVQSDVKALGLKRIGLLATNQSIRCKIYDAALQGTEIITLDEKGREDTTRLILDSMSGKNGESSRKVLERLVVMLLDLNCEKVILGCTDLSIIPFKNEKIIDSLAALAQATVRLAAITQP